MGKWMTERTYEYLRDFVMSREEDIRLGIEDFDKLRPVKMWLRAVNRGERDMIVPPKPLNPQPFGYGCLPKNRLDSSLSTVKEDVAKYGCRDSNTGGYRYLSEELLEEIRKDNNE